MLSPWKYSLDTMKIYLIAVPRLDSPPVSLRNALNRDVMTPRHILHFQCSLLDDSRMLSLLHSMKFRTTLTTHRIILHFATSRAAKCANTMEKCLHWGATSSSANPEIPCILWNPRFSTALITLQNFSLPWTKQIQSKLSTLHLKIMFPSVSRSTKRALCFRFPHQNPLST